MSQLKNAEVTEYLNVTNSERLGSRTPDGQHQDPSCFEEDRQDEWRSPLGRLARELSAVITERKKPYIGASPEDEDDDELLDTPYG